MSELDSTRFKVCTKCGCTKPATTEFFHKKKDCRYGVKSVCRVCCAAQNYLRSEEIRTYNQSYREKNREALNESKRIYRAENKEKLIERDRKYRERNKEKLQEKNRRWGAENRAARAEYMREYHKRTQKARAEYGRQWYEQNREEVIARSKRWAEENPDKARARGRRRRARKRNAEHEPYAEADLNLMWHDQSGTCYYCAMPMFADFHVEHKTPLSRAGADKLGNICLACPTCNLRKGSKTAEEFFRVLKAESC